MRTPSGEYRLEMHAGEEQFDILSLKWSQRVMNNIYLYIQKAVSQCNTNCNYTAVIT